MKKKKIKFYKFIGVLEKKNFCCKIGWATAQLYYEKKIICIATLVLYCKREGWKKIVVKIVLQYHFCIAGGVRLYCSIGRKIVL